MTRYTYTVDNSQIDTFDLSTIPQGYTYTTTEVEEIIEPLQVPNEVALWKIKAVLKLMNLYSAVETALQQLEEPTKTLALSIFENGSAIDRHSPTTLFIISVLELTDEQADSIFIQANEIQL